MSIWLIVCVWMYVNEHLSWLVVLTILKHTSSSMGRMTSHILWKIKNVPNHQPVSFWVVYVVNRLATHQLKDSWSRHGRNSERTSPGYTTWGCSTNKNWSQVDGQTIMETLYIYMYPIQLGYNHYYSFPYNWAIYIVSHRMKLYSNYGRWPGRYPNSE